MDKLSYALGLNIGQQLRGMGMQGKLVASDFAAAVEDMVEGKPMQISETEANQLLNEFFTQLEKEQQAKAAEAGKAAKEAGEKFLAENAAVLWSWTATTGIFWKSTIFRNICPMTGRRG